MQKYHPHSLAWVQALAQQLVLVQVSALAQQLVLDRELRLVQARGPVQPLVLE